MRFFLISVAGVGGRQGGLCGSADTAADGRSPGGVSGLLPMEGISMTLLNKLPKASSDPGKLWAI